mmetsp:Transcript_4209/g.9094  ORF Transcript_4209/g.9094 Transcript_4209/m.9094 type:complete len:338 (-) Transcript_4209:121-1134(-)
MPIYTAEEYEHYINQGSKVKRDRHHPLPNDCATSDYPRLIHDKETWRLLQSVSYELTEAPFSYHHKIHARHRYLEFSGLNKDLAEVRDYGEGHGRGRSVYATAGIPRGTLIWRGDLKANNGFWYSPRSMKAFLKRLPHDLQCDVLLWAYATGGRFSGTVECNLDEASYFNHGERPELVNVVNTLLYSFAARDIAEGEELLMDYTSFIALGDDSLPWWDDLRNTAWRERDDTNNHGENKTDSINSGSNSVTTEEEDICMDEYVKYGKPIGATIKSKSPSSTIEGTPSSTVFADASLVLPNSAPMVPDYTKTLATTITSFFLALVLARAFVRMGMRHRY